eukprot:3158898-Pyramimonas_sp.AAC.1
MCKLVFLPKGEIPLDRKATKAAEETRPLALSNTDQKLMASSVAYPLKVVVQERLHGIQRGFIGGRKWWTTYTTLKDRLPNG